MIINTAQGGGGSLPLNLHVQPDEPAVKEGVWIKAPEAHTVKQITTKDSFVIGGTMRGTQDFATNLNPASVTHGYLLDGNYLYWITYENTSEANYTLAIARYDLTTNTRVDKPIYNFQAYSNNLFRQNRYSIVYKKDSNIWFRGVAYSGNSGTYYGYQGSFDPSTFDTLDHIETSSGSILPVDDLRDYPCIAKNDTCAIFMQRVGMTTFLQKFDFQTNTLSTISQASNETTAYYIVYGVIYDGIFYYLNTIASSSNTYNTYALNRYDTVNNKDLSPITFSLPFEAIPCTVYTLYAYQNKIIIPYCTSATSALSIFDITTLTRQSYPYAASFDESYPCLVYQTMFLFCEWDNTGISISKYSIFDFQSESLDQNQLVILNGRDYSYKLVSTTKMNYLRAVMNNVWWYDTDFKEYPTYIGNGTSFTKIKN